MNEIFSVLHQAGPRCTEWLRGCFPGACPGLVDDALAEAYATVAAAPGDFEVGEEEALRRLRMVAWRSLRGTLRRACYARQAACDVPEIPSGTSPDAVLEAVETNTRLETLILAAGRRFGGRRPERVARAVAERLDGHGTDSEVAARAGLPRETLNRARRWVERELLRTLREAA